LEREKNIPSFFYISMLGLHMESKQTVLVCLSISLLFLSFFCLVEKECKYFDESNRHHREPKQTVLVSLSLYFSPFFSCFCSVEKECKYFDGNNRHHREPNLNGYTVVPIAHTKTLCDVCFHSIYTRTALQNIIYCKILSKMKLINW
jgi:hypothetical protein